MGETAFGVDSSVYNHRSAAELSSTPPGGRNGSVEEAGPAAKRNEPVTTEKVAGRASRTRDGRGGKRLRILVAGLTALLMVHLLSGVDPNILGIDSAASPPLDRCVTQQAVLSFLDGQSVVSTGLTNPGASAFETITLQKEKISSLKIESGEDGMVLLRFNLDHNGRRSPVEASFMLTHSDSPELHWHGWEMFMGQVVPTH